MTAAGIRIDPADWPDAVADHAGPQLIVGGPGTGKTEFLVRRAASLITVGGVAPERLLLLSFSRRGAADLRGRLERRLDRSFTTIHASTFHSLAHRIIEQYGDHPPGAMPALLTGPEQVTLVHDLLRSDDPALWPVPFRSLLGTATFAREVTDFILRCREQLIDREQLGALAAERADWDALPGFLARYDAELDRRGRLDYGTLLERAIEVLGGSHAADVAGQFEYVLVDEYQDTTRAQAELLHRTTTTHRNLTVAADPYQSIYSFRGAELSNVADFPERFRDAAGTPARRLVLTTSFRVPAAILDAAVRITSGADLPGAAGPVTPAAGEGSVEAYGFIQHSEEAEWIASEVHRMHLENGIPFRRMAVFVRSKRRFLPELSRSLERRRIPHDPPDARLADHPAVRFVLDAATATESGPVADRAIRRLLLGPLFATPLGALNDLERIRYRTGLAWPDVIREHVPDGHGLADLLADPAWAVRYSAADGFWHLWERLPQIERIVHDPHRAEERAAWNSLAQVLGRITERDPEATLATYRRLVEEEDFEARPLLSYRAPAEDRLVLTTLHQSKGLEFDVVFIADAVEGVFPDLRARDSLLGVRHLSRSMPTDTAAYLAYRLQEEMRLAYTAMTRASRRVVWTATVTGFDEGEGVPSRFLPLVTGESAVDWAARRPPARSRPVTPLEAEAWLRRMVRDPAAGAATRFAALDVLRSGGEWGLRHPENFAGIARRGADTGLVDPGGIRLSPSRAENYLSCPRRYALEHRLHVGDEPSVHASFGSLIHEVLEQAERGALASDDVHAELDDVLAVLDAEWDPAPFGGDPWASAWKRRAVEILTRLYSEWPSRRRPVVLEHRLEHDIDGITWSGRADRVERNDDGGLVIVDYKTSRNAVAVGTAAESAQLGFYLLAARYDDTLTDFGEPVGAEMWFPASRQKHLPVRAFDPGLLNDVVDALRMAASGIAAESWPVLPGPDCDRCGVRLVCPAWPDGKESFAP